jgi:diguanylate cyclase (GGDEF)-like protein
MEQEKGKQRIRRLLEAADALPSTARLAVAIALLLAVAIADWLTPNEVAFAAMYIVPVGVAAWFVSPRAGTLISIASTILWFSLNLAEELGSSWVIGAWNVSVRLAMFLFVSALVGGARGLLDAERRRSRVDALTDVLNARAFYEIVQREIARTRRYRRPMSVAYIDIDDFKDINDHFGHVAGDELLRTFARCVQETIRSIDSVARLGGDEFVVLMPETDTEGAMVAIQRLTQSVYSIDSLKVGVSIGVVTCDDPVPESIDEIVRRADTLMYTAKHLGKHRFIQGHFSDVIDSLPSRQTAQAHSG